MGAYVLLGGLLAGLCTSYWVGVYVLMRSICQLRGVRFIKSPAQGGVRLIEFSVQKGCTSYLVPCLVVLPGVCVPDEDPPNGCVMLLFLLNSVSTRLKTSNILVVMLSLHSVTTMRFKNIFPRRSHQHSMLQTKICTQLPTAAQQNEAWVCSSNPKLPNISFANFMAPRSRSHQHPSWS